MTFCFIIRTTCNHICNNTVDENNNSNGNKNRDDFIDNIPDDIYDNVKADLQDKLMNPYDYTVYDNVTGENRDVTDSEVEDFYKTKTK